ncbi:hypothetical protein HI921_11475 [Enterococcus mundtii]|uniref:Uncharacterized protein n=2 Tax=Enterococcus mundtii TaxID=53346 RepID=A0A848MZ83_ENTMU|nr:hypothetical protein [Enterococcus mundtii]
MNVSEEYKITAGTISGATLKSIDIEPSIIVDGKSYTASEFNKAVEMLKQPQLNENQQIVLEWLKEYMLDNSDFYNTIYASKQLYSYGVPYGEESKAFTKLNNRELAQVLEVFSRWAQEQEEE